MTSGGDLTMVACTVTANASGDFYGRQGGIGMAQTGSVAIRHSILSGNDGRQLDIFAGGADLQSKSDVAYSLITHDDPSMHALEGRGVMEGDPLFKDPANGDYRLRADSPCIDAGDPAGTLDPDGSRPDLGALSASAN